MQPLLEWKHVAEIILLSKISQKTESTDFPGYAAQVLVLLNNVTAAGSDDGKLF